MKKTYSLLLVLLAASVLAGCASKKGCRDEACNRADSNQRQLVIWWPEDMRQGLGDENTVVDFTTTPIEN